MRKSLNFAAMAAAVGMLSGVAQAAPLLLPADSPIFVKYNNVEQVCLSNCIGNTSTSGDTWSEGNWGLVKVTTINVGTVVNIPPNNDIGNGSPTLFADGVTPGSVTGIFYGVDFTAIPTQGTGGYLDLYWNETSTANVIDELNGGLAAIAANRTAQDAYTGFTDGEFLVRLKFMPGVLPSDASITTLSTTDPSTGVGAAFSYQDVDMSKIGLWSAALDGDWFLNDDFGAPLVDGSRDTRTQSNYTPGAGWSDLQNGIVGLKSEDPVRAFTVPAPGSLALLGLGLAGFGFRSKRQRKI